MSTWENYKKNRKSNFDKLQDELSKSGKQDYNNEDDRFWYPSVDKVGNGYAVVRFLPSKDEKHHVTVFEHSFQGDGGWYIEKCLTTLNRPDPVAEYNTMLWNKGGDGSPERAQARKQKRKMNFIANVYVIKDTEHPENEGKVKLFKFGKQIFDVIFAAVNPQFPDDPKIDPFDVIDGANLLVKIRNKDGYRNYESSKFDSTGPLLKEEKKMKEVFEKTFPIAEFVDPANFKSYDELKTKFNKVLGIGDSFSASPLTRDDVASAVAPKKAKASAPKFEPEVEDDDDLNYFNKIAEDEDALIS
jgi:hypothetical protein